jgi:5-methyltetrahydropteroyltriglutamate--homocysteine methyltransferase
MGCYPKYATTVVGGHSVPGWYKALEQLAAAGSLPAADMREAQCAATQAAILDQEIADIDIVSGGEVHRRSDYRHAPACTLLDFFWQKIPAFRGRTMPRAITTADATRLHPTAVCRGPITDDADLGLVDEYRLVRHYARHDVKVTVTGPHMLAKIAYDEYYSDIKTMMLDLGKLIRHNFSKLKEAGCRHVQISEHLFPIADEDEIRGAIDAINLAVEGLKLHVQMHICQSNYSGDSSGRRYPAKAISDIDCDVLLVEHEMAANYEGLLGNKQLAVGAADVRDMAVETPETIADRVARFRWLAPEQTMITTSDSMSQLPRPIALGKLQAMSAAKRLLAGRARTS